MRTRRRVAPAGIQTALIGVFQQDQPGTGDSSGGACLFALDGCGWMNLGAGLAGTNGMPSIEGEGTDPAGALAIGGTWPSGVPSGFTSYYQYWIIDSAGELGFAAGNSLSATTP